MSMADDMADYAFDYNEIIEKQEKAELRLLKGKWTTKDGRKICIFDKSQCDDNHFANICKMIERESIYGVDWLINELKRKRAKYKQKSLKSK